MLLYVFSRKGQSQNLSKKREEEQLKKIQEESMKLRSEFNASLPEVFKAEFEQRFIFGRNPSKQKLKRDLTVWRAVQRMLIETPVDPVDWYEETFLFYDYFYKKKFSFSYIRKILNLANLWGQFLSRKLGQYFNSVPVPLEHEKARLLEAYFKKCNGTVVQSDPLAPERLEEEKQKLKPEYYNWLLYESKLILNKEIHYLPPDVV